MTSDYVLLCLGIANVLGALSVPLAIYILLRHGPAGGQPRDIAARQMELEGRKLVLMEDAAALQKQKAELEMAERREKAEIQKPFMRARAAAQANGFGPRNVER